MGLLLATALAALSLGVSGETTEADALAEGDGWYARRAEGRNGGVAVPGPADAAIAAYRRAVALEPSSLIARCRLMKALFFRASFCPTTPDQRRALREEAREVAERAVGPLEATTSGARGPDKVATLRAMPGAAQVYFWAAVSWGEWALQRGKLAAAKQGAGPRIRDLASTVIALDPDLEQGGGYRILGRLHDQAPKIPFLSGWVSRREALANLRISLEHGPENTVSQLFLAEAILDHEPARKEEARALLQRCASAMPRPEYLVEDEAYSEQARKMLARIR